MSARYFFESMVGASSDARRAWLIAPARPTRTFLEFRENGGWTVRSSRPFRLHELALIKTMIGLRVFVSSLDVRLARRIVIPRAPLEGLITNLLHVLAVLHRARRDAEVHVNWVLTGTERGFQYGSAGEDVWGHLFTSLGPATRGGALVAKRGVEFTFMGTGKDYLEGPEFDTFRRAYSGTISKWLHVADAGTRSRVSAIERGLRAVPFVVGVHRRVPNAQVALLQKDGAVPTTARFIQAVRSLVDKVNVSDFAVFLATDDAPAVDDFARAFGSRLLVQDDVKRTTSAAAEVHVLEEGHLSLADAESVIADAILLSRCQVLVHSSSSLSMLVSLMNPDLRLVRLFASGEVCDSLPAQTASAGTA